MVSIPACHAGDPGSIPGNGVFVFWRAHAVAVGEPERHSNQVDPGPLLIPPDSVTPEPNMTRGKYFYWTWFPAVIFPPSTTGTVVKTVSAR